MFFQEFLVLFFDLQKGFTVVGHSMRSKSLPDRTRKFFELIFIFVALVSRGA